jgi:hypothetical protein
MSNKYFEESMLNADTENGKDWLRKALHPPGAKGVSYNGYPDRSVTPAVHFEYRLNTEIFHPAFDGNFNPTKNMLMLHSPSFLTPHFVANTIDDAGGENQWAVLQSNDQLDVSSMMSEMGKVQTEYRSETIEYDANGFNNSGMCYVAQFNPGTAILSARDVISRWAEEKHPDGSTSLEKYATKLEKDYPYVHDIIKHIAKNKSIQDYRFDNTPVAASGQQFQVVSLGRSITQPSDLTMLSPKSYTARSTEGAFIVHQINENTNKWCNVRSGAFTNGVTRIDRPLLLCCYETYNLNGSTSIRPFYDNASSGNFVYDVEWPSWSWALSFWVGMQPGAAGGSPPLLNIKTVHGIAITPVIRGILNPAVTNASLYDAKALNTYAVITQTRQDGMPSRFNVLGAIGGAIAASMGPELIKDGVNAIMGKDKATTSKVANQAMRHNQVMNQELNDADQTMTAKQAEQEAVTSKLQRMNINSKRTPRVKHAKKSAKKETKQEVKKFVKKKGGKNRNNKSRVVIKGKMINRK